MTTTAPGPLDRFLQQAEAFETEATRDFGAAQSPEELESARIRHLGDAKGALRTLQQGLGSLAKIHS